MDLVEVRESNHAGALHLRRLLETRDSQKNADTGRLYTECTRRYEPVKLAIANIANDIPFYSRRDALEYVSVSSGTKRLAKRALSLDKLTPGASILREKGMSRIAGSSS